MHEFEKQFGHWIIKYRWLVIIVTLLGVFAAASGGQFLKFTNNYRVFFSKDNPQLNAFDALERIYTKNDNVMFILTPKDGNVFTARTLGAVEALTAQAWKLPHSIRVDSISNFQYTRADSDTMTVSDLVKIPDTLGTTEIAKIKQIALSEPLVRHRIISPAGDVTAVNATIQLPGINETAEVPEVVARAREIKTEFEALYPDIEFRLTGMVMMNNAFSEISQRDLQMLVIPSFILMILVLAILLRDFNKRWPYIFVLAGALGAVILVSKFGFASFAVGPALVIMGLAIVSWYALFMRWVPGSATTFIVILLSILAAMGLGGFIGQPLSPPAMSAPTIILTVAIANCVHILVTFFYDMRQGHDKHTAIAESLRVNLQPVFLASLTTAIGFLSLNFSDAPPFRHLGNFVAFGVVVSFILSVTFLPALLSLLPVKVTPGEQNQDRMMSKLGDWVVMKRQQLMWSMGIVIIALVSFVPRNELNDIFVNYFDTDVEFRQNADYVVDRLTGLYVIDYSLDSGQSGAISEPGFQQDVAAFAAWYRAQPEVKHVNVFTDIMKRLNKNMHADDEAFYKIPAERDLTAQYLLMYEMSLPYGLDLNNQINIDKSSTRMTVSTNSLSSRAMKELEARAQVWLKSNTQHIKAADGSGPSIMFANIGQRNIKSMLTGTTVALILISMILILALRSLKIGLISLIPNLIPAAMGFGLWGLLVGEVGLALSVVTGMTLGIVVDDTVHFLSKYLRARREQGLSSEAAVRYAFTRVGRALVTTSVVLVIGFLVLSQSSFELNSSMGILTAIVITFALAADLLFLPALLMKLDTKPDTQPEVKPL